MRPSSSVEFKNEALSENTFAKVFEIALNIETVDRDVRQLREVKLETTGAARRQVSSR